MKPKKLVFIVAGLIFAFVVGKATYALFTDSSHVLGLSVSTTSLNLQSSNDNSSWGEDAPLVKDEINPGELEFFNIENIYPGYGVDETKYGNFYLRNSSAVSIPMSLKARFKSSVDNTPDAYEKIKSAASFKIVDVDRNFTDGWHTIEEWKANAYPISDTNLAGDESRHFRMYFKLPLTYTDGTEIGNEISGLTLDMIDFEMVGTQVVTP